MGSPESIRGDEAEELVRVHAVLDEGIVDRPDMLARLLSQLRDDFGMTNVNDARLARFSILSGDVPARSLSDLRCVAGLKSVQADQMRRATVQRKRG